MANICSNESVVYGPKEDVARFVSDVEAACEKSEYRSFYDVFQTLGFSEEELDNKVFLNGACFEQDKFELERKDEDCWFVKFWYDTRWSPAYEALDELLSRFYPTLKEVTIAEEPGCEVYVNTDDEALFFDTQYDLDGAACGKYTHDEDSWFADKESALNYLNDFQRRNGMPEFESLEKAEEWYGDESHNPNEDEEFFLHVHEYSER